MDVKVRYKEITSNIRRTQEVNSKDEMEGLLCAVLLLIDRIDAKFKGRPVSFRRKEEV